MVALKWNWIPPEEGVTLPMMDKGADKYMCNCCCTPLHSARVVILMTFFGYIDFLVALCLLLQEFHSGDKKHLILPTFCYFLYGMMVTTTKHAALQTGRKKYLIPTMVMLALWIAGLAVFMLVQVIRTISFLVHWKFFDSKDQTVLQDFKASLPHASLYSVVFLFFIGLWFLDAVRRCYVYFKDKDELKLRIAEAQRVPLTLPVA